MLFKTSEWTISVSLEKKRRGIIKYNKEKRERERQKKLVTKARYLLFLFCLKYGWGFPGFPTPTTTNCLCSSRFRKGIMVLHSLLYCATPLHTD